MHLGRRFTLGFVTVALAVLLVPALSARADDFPYSVQFTVCGYAGTEALTNFPVLVRLSAGSPAGFSYADCAAGGADIVFKDDAGNEIPREIDTWNTNGQSAVWVSVPVVTNGATFTMAYCNAAVTEQPVCQTNGVVWSAAGYKGVWHMNSVDPADSTTNGYNGTHKTANLSVVDGAVGKALNIPRSSTSDGVTCGSTLPNPQLTGGFTIEGWCRPTQYGNMSDGAAMFGKTAFVSLRINSATRVTLTTPGKSDHHMDNLTLPTVGEWWHFAATFKMNTANNGLNFYVNGQLVKTVGAGDISDKTGTTEMFLGNNQWNQAFKGDLDEMRLSASLRSADWVAASYATQHASDFLTAGPRIGGVAPNLSEATASPSCTNAQLSVTLYGVGDGATSASVSVAYGPEGGALSEPVVIAASATEGQTLTASLTGLASGTAYRYVFTAVNDLASPKSATVEGAFTTLAFSGPTLALSTSANDPESQYVSASVTDLGGAALCDLYFSYGPASGPLPAYTQVGTSLTAGATVTRLIENLEGGIAYTYSFAATNDVGLGTIATSSFTPGIDFPRPDVNVAEFSRGVKFTVTGYTGTSVLTNFPVLVRLANNSPTGFSYADFFDPDGDDLCFLDADGNGIPHEIDTWNTSGESLVWVTLPRMENGTEFAMWYRSSKSGSVIDGGANTWEDYTGVWHLSNASDGVQSEPDSTTNSLTATTHANSSAVAEGAIGRARRVSNQSGASDAKGRIFVDLADPAKRAAIDALTPTDGTPVVFTASFWLKMVGDTQWAYLIGRKMQDSYQSWALQFHEGANLSSFRIYSSGNSDNARANQNVNAMSKTVWRKVDIVWNDTQYIFYVDGGSGTGGYKYTGTLYGSQPAVPGSADFAFGGCAGSGYGSLNGMMDEVRVRVGNMGDDWVKADYDTVRNASFLSAGEVVSFAETPKPIATLMLLDSSAKYAQFSGTVGSCGGDATACAIHAKVWKTAMAEPDSWTLLASGIAEGASFAEAVTGLDPETAYSYKIKATNNLDTPTDSDIVEGAFTTGGTGVGGTGGDRMRVGNDYVHVFEIDPETGVDTFEFTPPDYVSSIRALVVAGGGPGGYRRGGGGGAGGLIHTNGLAVAGGSTYTVMVGAGGVASESATAYGTNGSDSLITSASGATTNLISFGGGAGGNFADNFYAGVAGGSGGGSQRSTFAGGVGTVGQGNAGGVGSAALSNKSNLGDCGGGGGGAVREGSGAANDMPPSGGSGGQGFLCDISGTPTWYAGGGGGGGTQRGTTASNLGAPGGGGEGGGGRGGMDTSLAGTSTMLAEAGTPGTGGGGGGGSDSTGFYQGANGGSGIVIVRYTVEGTGAGSTEPVVSLTGATYAGDLKIAGAYRVAWAGEGEDVADVFIKWGYSANSLTHSVRVAQDAIGTGSFEITVPVDQTTIYLRAMADNGTADGLSDEIVAIYVPEYDGVVPGDSTIPVFGAVSLSEVEGIFARVSGTVTSFGTAGEGEDTITNCVVYALVGLSDNVSRMTAQIELSVTAGQPFSYAIEGLTPATTYYWCLEARNSAGVVVATQVGSFTTLPANSIANALSVSSAQRTVNISGSLGQVGAGKTIVEIRWREGSDEWGDWTTVNTFDATSSSTAFNASHSSESWATTIYWEMSISNQCVTASGEPVGEPYVTRQSGSFATGDNATYTWQAVAGDWNGSWTNAAHWACTQADRRDYPDGSGVTVAFNNNTVATVEVPGDYTFKEWSIAKSGIDVTLVGQGAATSALRGNMAGGAVANSSWTFSALTFVESNGLDFGNTSVANNTITFTDGAVGSTGSGMINLIGSNVWLVVEKGASFQRAVRNCTKDGGIRLDDGTISGNAFRTDYNWTATTNEWFVFSGAAPRLTATASFRNDSANEAHLQNADTTFLFSVPARGWSAAPLYAEYSSSEKFGGMLGTGEGGYVITVDPDSPAISAAGKHKAQLVAWRSGIDTDHVWLAEPPEGVTISWTYGWPSTLDEPENEGDAPTGVKALIIGPLPPTVIILQ